MRARCPECDADLDGAAACCARCGAAASRTIVVDVGAETSRTIVVDVDEPELARQRAWFTWIERTVPALYLSDEFDREELAILLAATVMETVRADSRGGWTRVRLPDASVERERLWKRWLRAAVPALELDLAADRQRLAERLADTIGELPPAPRRN